MAALLKNNYQGAFARDAILYLSITDYIDF